MREIACCLLLICAWRVCVRARKGRALVSAGNSGAHLRQCACVSVRVNACAQERWRKAHARHAPPFIVDAQANRLDDGRGGRLGSRNRSQSCRLVWMRSWRLHASLIVVTTGARARARSYDAHLRDECKRVLVARQQRHSVSFGAAIICVLNTHGRINCIS